MVRRNSYPHLLHLNSAIKFCMKTYYVHIKRNEQCCSWNLSVCIIVFANSAVRSKKFFFSHFVKYFNVLGLKILPNQTWILFSLKRYFLRIDVLMWLKKYQCKYRSKSQEIGIILKKLMSIFLNCNYNSIFLMLGNSIHIDTFHR